jgi:UDP-N-acetyl-2-amino-2-deoxyglucuronate dehydrogenase
MDEIRVGIIGSGFMGRTHAEAIGAYTRGARLVAVSGGSRSEELARDYSIDSEQSVTSLLERTDVDAVVIATPQSVHAEQVIAAARCRKHVLLEKPMAVSLEDCRAMNNACRSAGVNLMIGFTQRYRRGNIEAKAIIDRGHIGRIKLIRETMIGINGRTVYPAWQQKRDNGGTLLGYGVHSIDRIRWFTGGEVQSVMAHCVLPKGAEVEFSSMLLMGLTNGQSASLLCDMECPPPGLPGSAFHSWIIGEEGIIDLDAYGELRVAINGKWEIVFRQTPIDWQKEGKFSPVRMQSYRDQDQEFIDSIFEHRQPHIAGVDGERAVEVALASYESSRCQRSIALPLEQFARG